MPRSGSSSPAIGERLTDAEVLLGQLAERVAALEMKREQSAEALAELAGPPADDAFLRALREAMEAWLPTMERVEGMAGIGGFLWACGRHPDRDMTWRSAVGSLAEMWKADIGAAAKYLQAVASVPRLKLLKALFIGRRSARDLMAASELSKGQTYANVTRLIALGLVRQPERDEYEITVLGCDLLALALAAGGDIVGPHAASRARSPRPPESMKLQ